LPVLGTVERDSQPGLLVEVVGVVAAAEGLPVVVVVEPLDFAPDDDVEVVVAEPEDFEVVVVEPDDFAVVVVDDEEDVLLVDVVVDFDVVAVEPRAAVVDVVFGFVDEVVSLSPVVVVVAPGLAVVVVVGLAFFGSGTVQVRRDDPS
jgi:hypothetical protein